MEEDVLVGYYVILGSQSQALTDCWRSQIRNNKLTSELVLYYHWGRGFLARVFTADEKLNKFFIYCISN